VADVGRVWAVGGGGRPPLPADERLVRFYRSTPAYERDVARLADAGWRVIKVVTPPHWTWRQLLAFGLPAGAQRQPELLVTYARSQVAPQVAAQVPRQVKQPGETRRARSLAGRFRRP
jgi:hypothetical protein